MNTRHWIRILLPILCISNSWAQDNSPITLEEAYRAALTKTESVWIQEAQLKQTRSTMGQARSSFLPILSFDAEATRQEDLPDSFNVPWRTAGGLRLRQNLFRRENFSAYQLQKDQVRAGEEDILAAKDILYANVATVFYNVVTFEQDTKNIEETIRVAKERVEELQKRVRIGRSKQTDVLAAEAQLLTLESEQRNSMRVVRSLRNEFYFQTGLQPNSQLDSSITPSENTHSLDHYLKRLESRPELESIRYQLDALQRGVTVAKGGYFPTLDFVGNYYFFRTGSVINQATWDFGFFFSLPLYSGGLVQSRVKEARALKIELEHILRQETRRYESQVRSLFEELDNLRVQVDILLDATAVTNQSYKDQEREYRFGLVTNLEVIEALSSYLASKRALDRTRYETMSLTAQLRAATHLVEPM